MYKVIAEFYDLEDSKRAYKAGDTFPRNGLKVNEKRIKMLSSAENKLGFPVIEEIKEKSRKRKNDARTNS